MTGYIPSHSLRSIFFLLAGFAASLQPCLAESYRRSAGPQAWEQHAMAAPENALNLPLIAIVIDDVGVSPRRVDAVLSLPAPVTLAVLPYAPHAARVAAAASASGHEILLHLPMESASGTDPGPQALLGSLSAEAFNQRLHWNLVQFKGYIGVNNHMGSLLTQNQDAMHGLHAVLRQRGLMFLDSRTGPRTVAGAIGRSMGVPVVERDIFLDNIISAENIRAQLLKTEDAARRTGFAIAIGHPHDATLAELRQWAQEAEARGFRLVPLSAMLNARRRLDSAALTGE